MADELVGIDWFKQQHVITIGNGLEEGVFLVPCTREGAKKRGRSATFESGIDQGATLVRDGRKDDAANGEWIFC